MPGRKAAIIFDPRALPCLSAEGARVEDDDRETFGGGIDRGREAGGSGAENRDVIGLIRSSIGTIPSARASSASLGFFRIVPFGQTASGRSAEFGAYCSTSFLASSSFSGSSN